MSVSISHSRFASTGMHVVTCEWTAETSGAFTTTTITGCRGMWLVAALTHPTWNDEGNPERAPTGNYDITLTDANQYSVVSTLLNNRSASAAELIFPTQVSRPIDSDLTLAISGNSVDRAKGTIKLYLSNNPCSIVAAA